ncbi:gliding motility lipoprotein GldH [Croceimicrobium sp.]|uniref:gliding motility lipoprotein GldH n=1 Tax=Croceimicrobium sp. TaxID=2828340 RepID=UPI003BAA0898
MLLSLKRLFLFGLLANLAWACSEKPWYENYEPVAAEGWFADSIASFEVEIEDTLSSYLIYFNMRGNNNYPYSNLYLFRKIYSEEGMEYSDTANLTLADPFGKWLGEGVGELKTFQRVFRREPLRFTKAGTYRFEFVQAMREDPLPGVEDIGISIYKQENGEAKN